MKREHRPGQLPVGRVDDLERHVDPELRPRLLDALLVLLVGRHVDRDEVVGLQRLGVGQRLEHAAVHAADEHDDGVVHAARPEAGRDPQLLPTTVV